MDEALMTSWGQDLEFLDVGKDIKEERTHRREFNISSWWRTPGWALDLQIGSPVPPWCCPLMPDRLSQKVKFLANNKARFPDCRLRSQSELHVRLTPQLTSCLTWTDAFMSQVHLSVEGKSQCLFHTVTEEIIIDKLYMRKNSKSSVRHWLQTRHFLRWPNSL